MNTESLFDMIDPPQEAADWKWTFADYPKEKNGLKVFSCFACGGGSTMGYKLSGCEVLGCVEIDPKMNEVYVKNHHPKYNYLMDIRDFNAIQKNQLPPELFDLDILDGSPPCTTFSMAGKREESWGKKRKFREGQKEQTLDDLSFVFIETVKKLRPRVVIMENVEGLILGEAFSYVQRIYSGLRDAGYFVNHWLLKSEEMGIPQRRHRVFFVAFRADLRLDPGYLDMSFNYLPITYGQIKENDLFPLDPKSIFYRIASQANEQDRSIADTRKRLGEKPAAFQALYVSDDKIVPTLRAKPCLIDIKNLAQVGPKTMRNAQTFPQDFDFGEETRTNVGYICGMSVPPVMIKRIVTRLMKQGVFDYAKSM